MKHATALAAVLGVASASAIPRPALPPLGVIDTCGSIDGCAPKDAQGRRFGDPNYESPFPLQEAAIGRRDPSPRGGRGGGGAKPGPGSPPPKGSGGGSSTGKDVAVEVGSGLITEGFGVGLDALVNGQPAPPAPPAMQKRDPKGGRGGGGRGGGSSTAKDFALGVGEGLLVEGAGVGLGALVNGQQPPPPPPAAPQKRDPKGGRGGGGAKPGPGSPPPKNGGGGSSTGKDVAVEVGSGIITEGFGVGLDALVNGQPPPPPPAAPQKRDPKGGRGGGGRGGGSSTAKDFALGVGEGLLVEGAGAGLNALVNGQQPPPPAPAAPQKRDPRRGGGGGGKPGPSSPPPSPGGGGSNHAKDFALGVGEGLLVEGAGVGLDALVNGQQPPPPPPSAPAPQKRDPKGGRGGGRGGGSSTGKDFAVEAGSGVITEGFGVGLDALVNGQPAPPAMEKRDPKGGRGGGGRGGGSSTGKDFAVEAGSGVITEGFGVGLDALVNGQPPAAPSAPQKRDPKGGRGGGRGGGSSTGKDFAVEAGSGVITEGFGVGLDALVNGQPPAAPPVPQKRDPKGGRGGGRGGGSGTGKDVAVEVGSGVITEGFGVGLDALVNGQQPPPAPAAPQKRDPQAARKPEHNNHATPEKRAPFLGALVRLIPGLVDAGTAAADAAGQKRSEDAVEAHRTPEKREPIIGGLVRLIPGLVDAGTAAADAASQKRSEDAVEARADSKGKKLGKKLGAAMADSDKESGASAAMGRPGMAGYLTAGLAVAVVVFGLNAL